MKSSLIAIVLSLIPSFVASTASAEVRRFGAQLDINTGTHRSLEVRVSVDAPAALILDQVKSVVVDERDPDMRGPAENVCHRQFLFKRGEVTVDVWDDDAGEFIAHTAAMITPTASTAHRADTCDAPYEKTLHIRWDGIYQRPVRGALAGFPGMYLEVAVIPAAAKSDFDGQKATITEFGRNGIVQWWLVQPGAPLPIAQGQEELSRY